MEQPTQDSTPLQCPVPHAANSPLPPGHPAVSSNLPLSSLHPPPDPRCVFFRTDTDLDTPPISRSTSFSLASGNTLASSTNGSSTPIDLKSSANINPLPKGKEVADLNPDTTLVLASRNSQLALVQSSQVSAMLNANYGRFSPSFPNEEDQVSLGGIAPPPPTPPPSSSLERKIQPVPLSSYPKEVLSHFRSRAVSLGLVTSDKDSPGIGPLSFPITSMSTVGDTNQKSPLYVIGGEGRAIWTKELEVALAAGAVDAIVHCLKDVPTTLPKGLELAAVLEREDPRDALVVKEGLPYQTLDELPAGSVVGTSSVRRVAQLRRRYPHLVYSDVRGNLNTRLAKLDSPTGPYTALVLAAAGLTRLNLSSRITAYLSSPVLLHSVGQGALTIEIRSPPEGSSPLTNRDARIKEMIQSIADWRAAFRGSCERGLLKKLEGGCSIPVGVESWFEDHQLEEGRRNEHGKGACPVVGPNGSGLETEIRTIDGEPKKTLGHTIPVKVKVGGNQVEATETVPNGAGGDVQVNGSSSSSTTLPSRPDTLERMATGALENGSTSTSSSSSGPRAIPDTHFMNGNQRYTNGYLNPTGPPSSVPTLTPTSPFATPPLMAEIRSIPPSTGRVLHLRAIVVSLDGRKSVSYSSSRLCCTEQDAESLGDEVAEILLKGGGIVELDGKELKETDEEAKDGAKSILEEVERHRAMAEEADDRRRREARANRAAEMASKQAKGLLPKDHPEIDMNNFDLEVDKCVFAIDGEKSEMKDIIRTKEVLNRSGRDGEQEIVDPLEIDRRGKPRDDGQLKAWEV